MTDLITGLSYEDLLDLLHANDFQVLDDEDPHGWESAHLLLTDSELLFQAIERGDLDEAQRLIKEEHVSVTRNNYHALFLACYHGLTELVSELLSMKFVDPAPGNPLAAACESGHMEAVKLLLADPRVDPRMDESMSIQLAAQSGHHAIVELLLRDGRAHPNRAKGNPLVCACAYNDTTVVNLLLGDPRVDPTVRDNLPLLRACEQNAFDVVKTLLARPEVNPSAGENKPLLAACSEGHFGIVKLLVEEYGVDPSFPRGEPFFNACYSGNVELVKFLLSFESVDPASPQDKPFQIAAQMNHLEILRILLQDPRVDPTARQNYSLDICSCSGHLEAVKLLLSDNRVLDTADFPATLGLAVEGNQKEVVEYLLSFCKGLTPDIEMLCSAVCIGNLDIVELLLSTDGVNPQEKSGLYPIQFAAKEGNIHIVKRLLKDPRVDPSVDADSALVEAIKGNYSELVGLLLQDPRVANPVEFIGVACKRGSVETLQVLLESPRMTETKYEDVPDIESALYLACIQDFSQIISIILDYFPDCTVPSHHLSIASHEGCVATLRIIHNKRKVDLTYALETAENEEVYSLLLSWHIWPKWQLILLGLGDDNSTLSLLPPELYTEIVRVAPSAYPKKWDS